MKQDADSSQLLGQGYASAVDYDGVVLVAAGGSVHELNHAAGAVWRAFDHPATVTEAVAALARRFGVSSADLAGDVADAVLELLDIGLLAPARNAGAESPPILEPEAACSGCGPGPEYEVHLVVQVGDAALAVGADAELADALAVGFGARALSQVDAPNARASYGVVVPEPATTSIRAVPRLMRGPDVLVRARRPERVVAALVAQVAVHELPPDHLALDAIAVGTDAGVVIVPVPAKRVAFERECARHGLLVADPLVSVIDPDAHRVVVGGPWLGFDDAPARAVLTGRAHLDGDDPVLATGSYPLIAIGVSGPPGLARVLGEVGPSASFAGATPLASLTKLVAEVPVVTAVRPAEIQEVLSASGARALRR